jgi:hypothetical protein
MLRNLFASVLIMGSAVVLSAPDAKAQSVDLTFSGTLGANCTFSAPTPGVLNFINGNSIGNSPLFGSASVREHLSLALSINTYTLSIR